MFPMIKKYSLVFLAVLSFSWSGIGQVEIINEPFRVGPLPTGWTQTNVTFETGAGGYARFHQANSTLTSPVIDLSGYTSVTLTFDVAKYGNGGDGPITVQVSDDGGTTWTAQTFDSPTPTSDSYRTSGPTSITATGSNVRIRFIRSNSASQKRFRDLILEGVVPAGPIVTYDGNGNTGGSVPKDTNNPYTSGDTVTVLGNTGTLSNSCHTFNGWNTAADGSGTSYTSGNTFTITTSTTLYAQWIPTGNTVTFNSNGGTGSMTPQLDCAPANLNNNPFIYAGYSFNSWNTAADGSGTSYADGATYNFSADITLYAQWDIYTGPCGGSESFDNSNALGAYGDGNYTGDNGVTWTYGHASTENSYPISGAGLMLRRASDSYLEATITGGIENFSFD